MNERRGGRREAGTVGRNAIRLDVGRAERVVEALNADLAGLLVLSRQLRKHRWTATGPEFPTVRRVLADARRETERGVDAVAERVVALGGVPLSEPAAVESHSIVPSEGATVYDPPAALEHDLDALGDLIEAVGSHVTMAESLGDLATGEVLRRLLLALERAADDVDRLLGPGL